MKEDQEFKVTLGYMVNLRPAWVTYHLLGWGEELEFQEAMVRGSL